MPTQAPRDDASAFDPHAVLHYLLAARLQACHPCAHGRPGTGERLSELRDLLVRSAESRLPFELPPVSPPVPPPVPPSSGGADRDDAPDGLVDEAIGLLDELRPTAPSVAGRERGGTDEEADGGGAPLVRALSATVTLARLSVVRDRGEPAARGAGTPESDPRETGASRRRARLCRTVLRPIFDELAARPGWVDLDRSGLETRAASLARALVPGEDAAGAPADVCRDLAERLRSLLPTAVTPALHEAAAGVQSLIELTFAAADRAAVDRRLDADETPLVRLVRNGPCIVSGGAALSDHLGDEREVRQPAALCRCGRSATRPFCDGSHVTGRFTDAKSAKREPDRLDRHAGQRITIRDNRGLCAHSGFCTDRLAGVFHVGEAPFVSPSGARVDEIARAVDKCPSGALSLELDGRSERHPPEQARAPAIEVSRDGPYRVSGGVRLVDETGEPVDFPNGGTLEHYSLCRCGASLNKPFCSGMHWSVRFTDPVADPARMPSVYEWAGGRRLLLDMTRIFYERHVPDDPLVGPLFARMSPDHPERVAAWLSEVFGGPALYGERYGGYAHMIKEHLGKRITTEQRRRWVALMARSADEAGLPDDGEFRAAFVSYLEWGSRLALENSQEGAAPPPRMPMPRWSWVADAYPNARPAAAGDAGDGTATEDAPTLVVPSRDEEVSFEAHIKPLFRAKDRSSMRFVFDLWSEGDVREHGAAILSRLEAGTMPCDGRWPAEHVALLARWLDTDSGTADFPRGS